MLIATALRMLGIKGETVIKLMHVCRREVLLGYDFDKPDAAADQPHFDQHKAPWPQADSDEAAFAIPMADYTGEATSRNADRRQPR